MWIHSGSWFKKSFGQRGKNRICQGNTVLVCVTWLTLHVMCFVHFDWKWNFVNAKKRSLKEIWILIVQAIGMNILSKPFGNIWKCFSLGQYVVKMFPHCKKILLTFCEKKTNLPRVRKSVKRISHTKAIAFKCNNVHVCRAWLTPLLHKYPLHVQCNIDLHIL